MVYNQVSIPLFERVVGRVRHLTSSMGTTLPKWLHRNFYRSNGSPRRKWYEDPEQKLFRNGFIVDVDPRPPVIANIVRLTNYIHFDV